MRKHGYGYFEGFPRGWRAWVLIGVVAVVSAILWVAEQIGAGAAGFFGGMDSEGR